jgi:hypothetical protein
MGMNYWVLSKSCKIQSCTLIAVESGRREIRTARLGITNSQFEQDNYLEEQL